MVGPFCAHPQAYLREGAASTFQGGRGEIVSGGGGYGRRNCVAGRRGERVATWRWDEELRGTFVGSGTGCTMRAWGWALMSANSSCAVAVLTTQLWRHCSLQRPARSSLPLPAQASSPGPCPLYDSVRCRFVPSHRSWALLVVAVPLLAVVVPSPTPSPSRRVLCCAAK